MIVLAVTGNQTLPNLILSVIDLENSRIVIVIVIVIVVVVVIVVVIVVYTSWSINPKEIRNLCVSFRVSA